MSLDTLLLQSLALLAIAFASLWAISLPLRNASIVDPCWGAAFAVVAWFVFLQSAAESWRSIGLLALTTVWGLRLSMHLLRRNAGHGEDRRYAAMRQAAGRRFWWQSLFTVFLLQAVILWGVAFPLMAALAADRATPFGWLDALGIAVWVVGFGFESVGDWQLSRFLADPSHAGRVMDRGLWRYTRHPNYFGDCCVWWGLYLIAAAGGAAWTVFSPLLMTFLLLRVSGVSLLESTIVDRRPEYADYRARTSAFFPWPPRPRDFRPEPDASSGIPRTGT